MVVFTQTISLKTKGNTDIIEITDQVQDILKKSLLTDGSANLFVPGSTGSLTTLEYEPGLVEDIKEFFEKIIPPGNYEHNLRWGDGNGHSHVRAALLGPSLSVPFISGELKLGTWQQIVFIDFDNRARSREIILQLIGE